jgi:ATP-dependent protease ClpP protease subunit
MNGQMQIIGEINDELATSFRQQLARQRGPITVEIDSEGGSVFSALKVLDALASYPHHKTARVSGAAFSAASYILTGFDEIEVSNNAYVMLHSPYAESVVGTAKELSSSAELLRSLEAKMTKAYARRMQKSEQEVSVMLDRETFMDAQQAVACGLADRIAGVGQPSIAASGKRSSELRRRAMVLAANRHRDTVTSKTPLRQAQEAWSRSVASYREQGLSGADAVSRANKEHPLIRQVLISAANDRRVN